MSRRNARNKPAARSVSRAAGDGWRTLSDMFGIGNSIIRKIDEVQALKQGAVTAAVDVISQDIAKARLRLVQETPRGSRIISPAEHRIARKLMLDPNEHQTWHEVNEMVIRCLAMHQNAFLIQNRRGSASDFPDVTPVHPARVTIQTSGDAFFYDVSAISNGEATILGFSGSRRLSEADVVHIKGRMHTGEQGLSTLLLGQNILGLNQALQDFQTAAAANGIRPNAVITTDANLNDEQFARLKVEIKEMLKSATDSGTPALLEAGMKYAPISVNAKDMDVVKSRQMVRQEVAALWRIPAYKIGAGETEKYDNKSTAEQTYVDDALVPVALRVESCLERAFLTERERMDGYTFVFDRDDLYDRDRQAASDRVVKQYMEGIITRGEARQKLGHGAVENNLDTYRVPVNAAILHQDGQLEYVTPIGANDPQNSTDDPLPAPEKSLRRTIQ